MPRITIRKVINECVEKGLFDTNPYINSRPMIEYVPHEVANRYRP